MDCPQRGFPGFQVTDRRIFSGLNFLIWGFFGVGNFWQVFFRDFWGYSKQSADL